MLLFIVPSVSMLQSPLRTAICTPRCSNIVSQFPISATAFSSAYLRYCDSSLLLYITSAVMSPTVPVKSDHCRITYTSNINLYVLFVNVNCTQLAVAEIH